MGKTFEDEFTEIQADMVSICLEYSGEVPDKIYIYGSMESGSIFFNVFYLVKGEVLHLSELNKVLSASDKIDDSSERQFAVLRIGVEDLEKLDIICKEYNQPTPTELKLIYDVNANSLKASYQYELQHSNRADTSADDIFIKWFTEMKYMYK